MADLDPGICPLPLFINELQKFVRPKLGHHLITNLPETKVKAAIKLPPSVNER